MIKGVVRLYNDDKAFGFICRNDGQDDVFVGFNALRSSGLDRLHVGERVSFDVVPSRGRDGFEARNIVVIE